MGTRNGFKYYKETGTGHYYKEAVNVEGSWSDGGRSGRVRVEDCFWDCGSVKILDKDKTIKLIHVQDVEVNDMIETSEGFKKVLFIYVSNTKKKKILKFEINCPNNEDNTGPVFIGLTPSHLLYNEKVKLFYHSYFFCLGKYAISYIIYVFIFQNLSKISKKQEYPNYIQTISKFL